MLCTVDVVALYPCLPHGEGLEAVTEAIDTLVGLASVFHENNFFEFNYTFYRQNWIY